MVIMRGGEFQGEPKFGVCPTLLSQGVETVLERTTQQHSFGSDTDMGAVCHDILHFLFDTSNTGPISDLRIGRDVRSPGRRVKRGPRSAKIEVELTPEVLAGCTTSPDDGALFAKLLETAQFNYTTTTSALHLTPLRYNMCYNVNSTKRRVLNG